MRGTPMTRPPYLHAVQGPKPRRQELKGTNEGLAVLVEDVSYHVVIQYNTHVYIYIYKSVHMYVYIYIYTHLNMNYLSIYIYTYTHMNMNYLSIYIRTLVKIECAETYSMTLKRKKGTWNKICFLTIFRGFNLRDEQDQQKSAKTLHSPLFFCSWRG